MAVVVAAAYAAIAGMLKVYRGVNEVISTIMLNIIAVGISAFLLSDVFRNESSELVAETRFLPESARIPPLNNLVEALLHLLELLHQLRHLARIGSRSPWRCGRDGSRR